MLHRLFTALALPTVAVTGLLGAASSASAAPVGTIVGNVDATVSATYSIGTSSTGVGATAVAAGAAYSNVTNFTGQGDTNGGFSAAPTATDTSDLIADDLTLTSGGTIGTIRFSMANFNAASQSSLPRIRFYAANGAGGTPGTLIAGFNFNPVTLGASSITTLTFTASGVNQFVVPSQIWAGLFFGADGVTSGATLNNLGYGIFNPVNVGSSADVLFDAAPSGGFVASNPAGTTFNYTGNPVANMGWELVPVPEPTSVALVGLGLSSLAVRRRRRA